MLFCEKCGAQVEDDSAFCGVCGAPMNVENNNNIYQQNIDSTQSTQNAQNMQSTSQQPYNAGQQQQYEQNVNQQYQPNVNQQYQQNRYYQPQNGNVYGEPAVSPEYKPISPWGYIGYEILFMIPLVGFIAIIIFSVGGTANHNVKNFARAYLYVIIAVIILTIVASVLIALMGGTFAYQIMR
jgi:hypothetical protein